MGGDFKTLIGDKLKAAVSVAAVVEFTRRTGEWAENLKDTSRQLGISVEELQALQLAARRVGMDVDKIFNLYQRIETAATKATRSQKAFNDSFGKLGISMNQLKGPNRLNTGELAEKVIGASGPQSAFMNIVGPRNILEFAELQREFKGRSISEYTKANQSQIVDEGTVLSAAAAWEQIKEDVDSIANKLKPVAALFLIIVDGLLKMVNGIIGELAHIGKGIGLGIGSFFSNNITNKFTEWGRERSARNKSFGRAVGNFLPGLVTLGMWKPFGEEPTGPFLSEEARRESQGAAEGLGTVATFGAGGVAGTGKGIVPEMWSKFVMSRAPKMTLNGSRIFTPTVEDIADFVMMMKKAGATEEQIAAYIKEIGGAMDKAKRGGRLATTFGTAGTTYSAGYVGGQDVASRILGEGPGGRAPAPNRSGLLQGMGMGYGAGGGGNLAIGGVFGVDIQTKIIDLNAKIANNTERMVDLLELIVENSAPGDYGIGTGEGNEVNF